MKLKNPKLIIVHFGLFTVVCLLLLWFFLFNLFHNADNRRFDFRSMFKPAVLAAMLSYRSDPGISCQLPPVTPLPSWLDATRFQVVAPLQTSPQLVVAERQDAFWSLYLADTKTETLAPLVTQISFPGDTLTRAYAPIQAWLFYPDCAEKHCYLWRLNLRTGDPHRFPAFIYPDRQPLPHIRDVFFDEARQLVSYGTALAAASDRVIITPQAELIQTINEKPASNRQLSFQGYLTDPGYLVYLDPVSQLTYFYGANHIALHRLKCP